MKRHYQKAIAPIDLPAAVRAQLARPRWSLADRFKREEIFAHYRPKIGRALAEDHVAVAGAECRTYYVPHEKLLGHGSWGNSWRDAQANTLGQHRELGRAHLSRAYDEQAIRDHAENYSRICSKMLTLERRSDFAASIGIDTPRGRNITAASASARLDDPQWWRRQLRRAWTRRAENVLREIGIVRKGREPYASDDAVMARQVQKARSKQFMEGHVAANEAGEQLPLLHLAEHSVANPAVRRGEFMCRVRGFEEIAEASGHVAQFWTLTTPSAYHAQLAAGIKNPKFARHVVREAQQWLCKVWARVRAKLKRLSILMYGFRIAEPHHDGTPHWHLLVFCRPRDAETISTVIQGHWVGKDAEAAELGPFDPATRRRVNQDARCKLITIDRAQGSAVGYVAKYVSKNIDGAGAIGEATDDETGRAVSNSVRRVDAWASIHGIRQFQQVGGPPVTLWRECRRLTEAVGDDGFERIRCAADRGNWAAFIRALSFDGIAAGRRTALRFEREATGELSKYSEEKPAPVIGLRFCSAVEITRPHSWRIQRCGTISTNSIIAGASGSACVAPNISSRASAVAGGGLVGLGLGAHRCEKRKRSRARAAAGAVGGVASQRAATSAGAARFISDSRSFSDLGPVAITVRGTNSTRAGVVEADPGAGWPAPGEPSPS